MIVFSDVLYLFSESVVWDIVKLYKEKGCDVLVVFGLNWVINFVKFVCVVIVYDELFVELFVDEGGFWWIVKKLFFFYVVLGVLGFLVVVSDFFRVMLDDGC